MFPFVKFDKIPRLSRNMVITEKIDGTNAQIYICTLADIYTAFAGDYQNQEDYGKDFVDQYCLYQINEFFIFAGSRNRWLSVGTGKNCDNHGFAGWVKENAEELFKLGEGRHFGEWYGKGIQRNYGLDEKRFALFNVKRWSNIEEIPNCCEVVPVLYEGMFDIKTIEMQLELLKNCGSKIAPGFKNPEGIVIFHKASGKLFKKTIIGDEKPKGKEPNGK